MGIRFNTNTWRAPLLLIDSWLPTNPQHKSNSRILLPQAVQRFARAGWLGRAIDVSPASPPCTIAANRAQSPAPSRACHVRVLRVAETQNTIRQDARLVISGRINDVCAELERLAALEHRLSAAQT